MPRCRAGRIGRFERCDEIGRIRHDPIVPDRASGREIGERTTVKSQPAGPRRCGEIALGIETAPLVDLDGVDPGRRIALGQNQRDHSRSRTDVEHPPAGAESHHAPSSTPSVPTLIAERG